MHRKRREKNGRTKEKSKNEHNNPTREQEKERKWNKKIRTGKKRELERTQRRQECDSRHTLVD